MKPIYDDKEFLTKLKREVGIISLIFENIDEDRDIEDMSDIQLHMLEVHSNKIQELIEAHR